MGGVEQSVTLEVGAAAGGEIALRLGGRLDAYTLPAIWTRATQTLRRSHANIATVEASAVTYCDAVGAALLVHLRDLQSEHGGTLRLVDFPEQWQPVVDLLLRAPPPTIPPPTRIGPVAEVGQQSMDVLRDVVRLIGYVGEIFLALVAAVRRPRTVRWHDMLRACQTAGVQSFPVVVLVALLIGLVMGFQSALQLRSFGGDIYLANLIGVSMVRELGPLMTAVVLTARSGSAFAAEIGTMRIREEVDALKTMGIGPVRFLVTPRILAAVVMTPLLTMFANLAGLVGGAIVWRFTLGLALPGYVAQLEQALHLSDLLGGLLKATVFGLLVAAIGCLRGLETQGGADAVGQSTTNAVVSSIVLIALADSAFSVIYFHLGI